MKYGEMTFQRTEDLINKMGGLDAVARFQSGELILAEKSTPLSKSGLQNGGITYASGLDTTAFLEDWTRFYLEMFNRVVTLSSISLPPFRPGFNWGVAGIKDLTKQQVFEKTRELVGAWKYTDLDLDAAVPQDRDERSADNGDYIIWCRDRVEADEELKNLSANQISERKLATMTLMERLLLGLWFFWKTRGHLDIKNYTNCTGSRNSDGHVPHVYRGGGRVKVSWYGLGDRSDDFRSREVVSVGAP